MGKPKTLQVSVSERFLDALRKYHDRAYRVWRSAGVDPTTGSKLIHGAYLVHENDPRIIAVGKILGLKPLDCFELVREQARG